MRQQKQSGALAVIALAFFAATSSCVATPAQKTGQIASLLPQIAHFGRFALGVTTLWQFTQQIGSGRIMMGGHSNSGREWSLRLQGWSLYTDGFEFTSRNQEILDTFIMEGAPDEYGGYVRTVPSGHIAFLGRIAPGMTRKQVAEVLSSRGLTPSSRGNSIYLFAHGSVRANRLNNFNDWHADLDFKHNVLFRINLHCS